jgi:adenosine deaminase
MTIAFTDHRVEQWSPIRKIIFFQTDDKGVFATSLSEEYLLTADSYDLSREQLWQMAMSSIDYTFASEEEKNHLKQMFMQIKELSDVQ